MKNIYIIILLVFIVVSGYLFSTRNSIITIPENFTENTTLLWKGLGYEPGFYMEISSMVGNTHHTKLSFQDGGEVEGDLDMVKTNGYEMHLLGDMMVGGDAAVPINVQIKKTACLMPSGEEVEYTLEISYADINYAGCAEKLN